MNFRPTFSRIIVVVAVLAGATAAAADPVRIGGTGAATGLLLRLVATYDAAAGTDGVTVVPGLGSGGALSAVAAGKLDIAVAGRALNDKERQAGLKEQPFLETPFVFVANVEEAVDLPQADIVRIFAGERVALPGGRTARVVLRPSSDAASIALVGSMVGMREALDKARAQPALPIAMTDQDTMEVARRIPAAFTVMTLTQLETEPNSLRRVMIDGVAATIGNLRSGRYSHKLLISLVTPAVPSTASARFLAYLASDAAIAVIEAAGALRQR